jgi:hypothetical protein
VGIQRLWLDCTVISSDQLIAVTGIELKLTRTEEHDCWRNMTVEVKWRLLKKGVKLLQLGTMTAAAAISQLLNLATSLSHALHERSWYIAKSRKAGASADRAPVLLVSLPTAINQQATCLFLVNDQIINQIHRIAIEITSYTVNWTTK